MFDLEWTAWEGSLARGWSGPGEHREVVQFGAVRIDLQSGFREVDSFSRLVRPRINAVLSSYFMHLTGINQEAVDASGCDFADALTAFSKFVEGECLIFSNGGDEEVLLENCALYGLSFPLDPQRFRNCHEALICRTGLPSEQLVSSRLPDLLGISSGGSAHTAIGDARSLARALYQLGQLQ